MSELLDLIRREENAIADVYQETLDRCQCRAFADLASAQLSAILRALAPWWTRGDESTVRIWAETLGVETEASHLPYASVLSGLSCFEKAVRYQVFKHYSQKRDLLQALRQLDDVVDLLRRVYAERRFETGGDARSLRHAFSVLADEWEHFVCLATPQGRPFYLNPAARRMLGLEADGLTIELPALRQFYTSDSWTTLLELAMPAVKSTRSWQGFSRLKNRSSGQVIDVSTKIWLVQGPHEHRPTCMAICHRLAAALPENAASDGNSADTEKRLRGIIESSLDPIITINHDGLIIEFNRAAEQVFGRNRQQVLGSQPSDVLFPNSQSQPEQRRIERYLTAGEGSMLGKRIEIDAVRANGEVFPAEMAMTISQRHGLPVLSFFIRDISLQKRAAQEQARYAAELERSNRDLEMFAYVASHDLQEPLRKIRTFGDRLQTRCATTIDDDGRQCLERMQAAATRMQSLINGLLTLSRVTTHAQQFVPVDLGQIADDVLSDLDVQIAACGGRVELGKMPTIKADPVQIRQLLQNLIGNGLKFHRPDEPPVVKVSARFLRGPDEQRPLCPEDELCRLVVEDNGIGFDEKHAERIFGVFERLHSRDQYDGTGVGLAICRKIAERHGGTIQARSVPGKGSQFEVRLPVAPRQEKAASL